MIHFIEKDLKSFFLIGDYDEIDDLYTKKFSENLEELEVMDISHPFFQYLDGFFHNLIDINIFHSYYNKETLHLKMYCEKLPYPVRIGIWIAWNSFNEKTDTLNIEIYDRYCGELYKDDFTWDDRIFYTWFLTEVLSKILRE